MMESKLCSSCLSQKKKPQQHEPPKTERGKSLLYLPECFLSIATKDWTRRESQDHRTRGLIYGSGLAWQGIVKFPHQEVIRVFVRCMVCLIEHK